jgi:single-strand DNA-binding protein
MSNDLNQWQGIGRLGKEVELRFTAGGDAVANFSIACGWKTKEKEGAEWVSITAFGKLAEICGKYLQKGSQVYVAGSLRTEKYQDKTSGQDRYSTKIIADKMQMLGGKAEGSKTVEKVKEVIPNEVIDDIPF